ncbi:MAG: zinc ribbon domain-containing protein [Chloroflexota bacterium]|nr:MAG: zinc ribbon domain-containing protein [Chloroflexota bacterium]
MKWLILSIVLVGLMLVGAVPAAAEPDVASISDLTVSVWPEYDEPRVLVMYEGKLRPNVSLPQKVRFRVPKEAEVSEACGLKKPDDEHLCQLYETAVDGDWLIVSYELPVPDFFMQVYYNPVSGSGQRAMDFDFSSIYPVDNLQIGVQQPARSSDFAVTPVSQRTITDQQGFKYLLYEFKGLPADKTVDLKINYTKPDSQPSVAKQQQGSATASATADSSRLFWIIVVVVMMGAIALVLVRQHLRGRVEPASAMAWQGTGSMRGAAVVPRPAAIASRAFCTQCGNRLRTGDRFCSGCGAGTGGAR